MSKEKVTSSDNLKTLLGHDLFKKGGAGAELFNKAKEKIQKEKDEKNLQRIEDLMRRAIDSEEQMEVKRREFKKVEEKHQKELGKLVNQLRGMAGEKVATTDEDVIES